MLLTDGKPETAEDFLALERFPEDVIAELKCSLPCFVLPEAEADFPLAIRHWAAFTLDRLGKEKPRPWNKTKVGEARKKLTKLADKLAAAGTAWRALPDDVEELLIQVLVSSDEPAAGAGETLAEARDRVVEVFNSPAQLAKMATAARRVAEQMAGKTGPQPDEILIEQIHELKDLYRKFTGLSATLAVESKRDHGTSKTTGPFFDFATLALKRLLPKRRSFEHPIRAALYGRNRGGKSS